MYREGHQASARGMRCKRLSMRMCAPHLACSAPRASWNEVDTVEERVKDEETTRVEATYSSRSEVDGAG